jgi:hypothetical protein
VCRLSAVTMILKFNLMIQLGHLTPARDRAQASRGRSELQRTKMAKPTTRASSKLARLSDLSKPDAPKADRTKELNPKPFAWGSDNSLWTDDIGVILLQNFERISCLRILFCVNKRFGFFCRQRLASLRRDVEARIRNDIRYVLNHDMPGINSEQQLMVNGMKWFMVKSALIREHKLYDGLFYKRKLFDLAEKYEKIVRNQLFVEVREQQKRLQAITDENSPLPDKVAQRRNEKTKRLLPADIMQKNVNNLHEKIMKETSSLLGEANSLMALDKQAARVQMQLARLHTLIDESNPKMQAAARGTRRSARKHEILQVDASVMADLHKKVIDQALTLQEVAKDILIYVQERIAEVKASRQLYKSSVLKINRDTRQGLNQGEKYLRMACSLFAKNMASGSRAWIAGRRAAVRRIQAALADRLRMGARTRTVVGREPGGGEGGISGSPLDGLGDIASFFAVDDFAVSFAEEFQGP